MAIAETARLIASLELDPRKFVGGANTALGKLGQVEGRFGRLGSIAAQGARNAGANIARIGAIAAGGVALAVRGGISSLAELEDATTSVQGAIEQVGIAGQVSAGQVATWANEIETSVQAAFDDKEITQAATTLIRFGKVTPKNLRPALVVMTDLAAKTGSVDSASSLLAKAMAAPEKAAGKLARVGVILTKQQQKQITAMVDAGDTAGAQALLLDALAKSTEGAAAASAGPYRDALNTLSDVSEDAKRALAEGFLPIIQRVATVLSEKMADPAFIEQIRDFGRKLAGAFDRILEIGGRIPWGQIGDSLKVAGAGAKAVFDAFAGLPAWIQTAVLTGWGLNKLTGGAVFKIGVELVSGAAEGLFKQFFARGATPAHPLFVSDVLGGKGGIPPAAGAGGAAAGGGVITGLLSAAGVIGGFIAIGESAAAVPGAFDNFTAGMNAISNKDLPAARDAFKDFTEGMPTLNPLVPTAVLDMIQRELAKIPAVDPNRPSAPVTPQDQREHNRIMQQSQGELVADTRAARDKIEALRISSKTSSDSEVAAFNAVRDKVEAGKIAATTSAGLIVAAIGKPPPMSPDERDEFHTLQLKNAATRDAIEAGRIATVSAVGTVRDKIEAARIAQVTAIGNTNTAVNTVRDRIEAAKIATTTAIGNVPSRIVSAAHSDTDRIVTAIKNNAPKITIINSSGSPDDRNRRNSGTTVVNSSGSPDDR